MEANPLELVLVKPELLVYSQPPSLLELLLPEPPLAPPEEAEDEEEVDVEVDDEVKPLVEVKPLLLVLVKPDELPPDEPEELDGAGVGD